MKPFRRRAVLFSLALCLAGCGGASSPTTSGTTPTADAFNGPNEVVVKTSLAVPTSICPNGGVEIKQGLDTSPKDGQLTGAEILGTDYVCNGAPGATGSTGATGAAGFNALVANGPAPSLAVCPTGGVTIQYGMDADWDNALDPGEVAGTQAVCNGANGTGGGGSGVDGFNALILTNNATTAQCADGGVALSVGLDTNRSGALDTTEISQTQFVCNGINGSSGTNGIDGFTALVNLSDEAPGGTCGTSGGVRIQTGLDLDRNNVLAAGEVTQTKYVCGTTGGGPSVTFDLARFQEAVKTLEGGDLMEASNMLGDMKSRGALANDNARTLYALTNVMMVMEEAQYSGVYKNFLDKVGAFAAGHSLFGSGEYHILENALTRPIMSQVVVTSGRDAAIAMLTKIENSIAELDAITGPVYLNLNFLTPNEVGPNIGGGAEMGASVQPVNIDSTDVEVARGILYLTAAALNYTLAYDPQYGGNYGQLYEVTPRNMADLVLAPDYAARMTSSKSYLKKAIGQAYASVSSLKAETTGQTYDFFQMAPDDMIAYARLFSTLKAIEGNLNSGANTWIPSVEEFHGAPNQGYISYFPTYPCEIYREGRWEQVWDMYGGYYTTWIPAQWERLEVAAVPYYTVFTQANPTFAFSSPVDGTKVAQDFAGNLLKYKSWQEVDPYFGYTTDRDAFWIDPGSYLASEITGFLPNTQFLDAPKIDNLGNPVPNTDLTTPWRRTPTGLDVMDRSLAGTASEFSWTMDQSNGVYIESAAIETRTYESAATEVRGSVSMRKGGRAARSFETVDFKLFDGMGNAVASDKPWDSPMDFEIYNNFSGEWTIGRNFFYYKKINLTSALTDGQIYNAEVMAKDGRHMRRPIYFKNVAPPPMIREADLTLNAWQANGDLKLGWIVPTGYTNNIVIQFLDSTNAQILSVAFPSTRTQATIPAWVFQRIKDKIGTPTGVRFRMRTVASGAPYAGDPLPSGIGVVNVTATSFSNDIPITLP